MCSGKELAGGVSGPKGEEIGEVVKAIDGIVKDLKDLGDAVSLPVLPTSRDSEL